MREIINITPCPPQGGNKINKPMKNLIILFASILLTSGTAMSQSDSTEVVDADALARELANPTAVRGTMNFFPDVQKFKGDLPDANQMGYSVSFQPGLPKPLDNGLTLFVRPLVPLIFTQPIPSENGGFEGSGVALGNVAYDIAMGKTTPSGLFYFFGAAGTTPTATKEEIRGQWALGPEFLFGKFTPNFVSGVLVSQLWGLEDRPDRTNVFSGQYFYAIPIGGGRVIGAGPTYTYDWENEQLTLPIGTGYSVTKIWGKTPIKLGFQFWYYVAQNDQFGPDWTIRFQISPVVNLPWKN